MVGNLSKIESQFVHKLGHFNRYKQGFNCSATQNIGDLAFFKRLYLAI